MSPHAIARLAMVTASLMLAHHVAARAFRDAAFLAVWPTTALPLMMAAAAIVVVAAVPLFAALLDRFGPRLIVPAGFVISAGGHAIEWWLSTGRPWVAIAVYLHVAGFGALLLSGFWSVLSERFDPGGARTHFNRIAAAGTAGGALGGLAAERMAAVMPADTVLLLLAGLHVLSAAGVHRLGLAPVLLAESPVDSSERPLPWRLLASSPNLRTIALMVLITTAGATVLDYLLKWQVSEAIGTGPHLLRFFAIFYAVVQVGSFAAQMVAGRAVRRLGIGRTMAVLPAGVGVASVFALLFPVWPLVVTVRGIEAVLRYSFFRSGYELLFIPMDATERRRMKTFLDVTCDRVGEAIGAGLVQVLLLTSLAFLMGELLAVAIALGVVVLALARRVDRLYLGVVEQQLARRAPATPMIIGTETGWTVLDLPSPLADAVETTAAGTGPPRPVGTAVPHDDPRVRMLSELRSGERPRVEAALARLSHPDRIHVAQIIELLAWDDLVGSARAALERVAASHVGLLVDALLDPGTDFAIRRRVPRILGTLESERALDGLVRGLDDPRFEVRYQCGRAIDRMLLKGGALAVDRNRLLAVVDRELSMPAPVWHGHRLIDQPDGDDKVGAGEAAVIIQRNLEHLFSLLATTLPREPLTVALRGLSSPNTGLHGLALEYLEGVLPASTVARLRQLMDVPAAERGPSSPEEALARLSAELPAVEEEE